MAAKLKVTYDDGREVEVVATPRAQVETERYLKGFAEANLIEAGYRLAYESLRSRKLLADNLGYEEFLDTILDVEELEDQPADPTPEAPSLTSSSA